MTVSTVFEQHFPPSLATLRNEVNVDKRLIKIACSNCNMRELCMPIGLDADELKRVDDLVTKRPFVKRGSALFRAGDRFTSLFAIRSGFFKTCVGTEDGRGQASGRAGAAVPAARIGSRFPGLTPGGTLLQGHLE